MQLYVAYRIPYCGYGLNLYARPGLVISLLFKDGGVLGFQGLDELGAVICDQGHQLNILGSWLNQWLYTCHQIQYITVAQLNMEVFLQELLFVGLDLLGGEVLSFAR